MAASLHLVGYSKSSSSSPVVAAAAGAGLSVEFGRDVFSSPTIAGTLTSAAAVDAGSTVSTAPLGSLPRVFWTLGVAVFSESAMLAGRRLLFESLMDRDVRVLVFCFVVVGESESTGRRVVEEKEEEKDDATTGKSTDKSERIRD